MKAAFENTETQQFSVMKTDKGELWNLSRIVGKRDVVGKTGNVLGSVNVYEHFSFHVVKQTHNTRVAVYKNDKLLEVATFIRRKDVAPACRFFVKRFGTI